MRRQLTNFKIAILFLLVAGAMVLSGTALADVELAILPENIHVNPGSVVDFSLTVLQSGSAFNGYDAVIAYDPQYLEFIVQSGGNQEGQLMTDACPDRFHNLVGPSNSGLLTINHVLLCAGVSTTGPGVVHRLRFLARDQHGVTQVRLVEGTGFYLAGSEVTPVNTTDATITIGDPSSAPDIPDSKALILEAAPNPFNPLTRLSFEVSHPGAGQLDVYTPDGRRVRQLAHAYLEADHHEFWWDGTNDSGQTVGSGVYFVRLQIGSRSAMRSVTLVK